MRKFVFVLAVIFAAAMPAEAQQRVIYESPDELMLIEGKECVRVPGRSRLSKFESPLDIFRGTKWLGYDLSDRPGDRRRNLAVAMFRDQTWNVPSYATDAIVVLNGFSATYASKDHHVLEIGAAIFESQFVNGTLEWIAGVDLADSGEDDEVDACYHYLGLAWNSEWYDIQYTEPGVGFNKANRQILQWGFLGSSKTSAFLPLGYMFRGPRRGLFGQDRHLLQLGMVINRPAQSSQTNRFEMIGVMKDNNKTRTTLFGDVAVLSGSSVVAFGDETFPMEPIKDPCRTHLYGFNRDGCAVSDTGTGEETIYSIPVGDVNVAFPMLTGFDLQYKKNDEHVKFIGAWIDDIQFDAGLGTLSYNLTKVLTDKKRHDSVRRARATLVGVRRKTTSSGFVVDRPGVDQPKNCRDEDSCE